MNIEATAIIEQSGLRIMTKEDYDEFIRICEEAVAAGDARTVKEKE